MESSDTPDLQQCRVSFPGTAHSYRIFLLSFLLFGVFFSAGPWLVGSALAAELGAAPGASQVAAFSVGSATELIEILDRGWEGVPEGSTAIPALAPESLPAGLGELPIPVKKDTFVRAILPLVLAANAVVAGERREAEALGARLARQGKLSGPDLVLLSQLARRYRIPEARNGVSPERAVQVLAELRLRADQVPVSLALAQAALESGWGTSRFALEGNSLFGQWVFSSKGITPEQRPEGATYSVASFRDLLASVSAYMRNLNTSWAYAGYRDLRATMREGDGGRLDPIGLAGELSLYSSRREAYVAEVRAVIRGNRFVRFDDARMLPVEVIAGVNREPAAENVAMGRMDESQPPDA